ncbi:hypothetical protein F892_03102 [Acinetobacter vivianii]|uniref:Uncharacterized protein n=1 Tax=Acinetobacter vivianii TaxID=1776742 RepID=N9NGI0_9GAMM|nr:hypothetical protein F892_03102 [Acinetobacter vivianii]GGI59373.1 hypothetical protein GCM10011446_08680 [Acinetobacter vivianii]
MTSLNPKAPAKNGYKYKPQWGVLIHCKDEKHQQAIYEKNKSKGLKCKVLSL